MIGLAYRMLAAKYGMRISHGVAYGSIKGYATTMFSGSTHVLIVTTNTDDKTKACELGSRMNYLDTKEEFGVSDIQVNDNTIVVNFYKKIGIMKKIKSFIEWFYPILAKCDFEGVNICPECGNGLYSGLWKLIDDAAYYLHAGCAYGVESRIIQEYEQTQIEDTGTYGTGLIGALLGALLGALIWGIVFFINKSVILVSLVIGFLAEKGYNLFHGKQSKGKIAILIITIVFGVILGTLLAYTLDISRDIGIRTFIADYKHIPTLLFDKLRYDTGYIKDFVLFLLPGLAFAIIESILFLKKKRTEVTAVKIVDLE